MAGLTLQIVGLGMLFAWKDSWDKTTAIVFVTCAQALCGIAKDLTKLGGKTVTKLVTPEDKQNSLFKLVSAITGLKNSFKGVGYFIGAAMLSVSYEAALWMQIAQPDGLRVAVRGVLSGRISRTRGEKEYHHEHGVQTEL